MTDKYEPKSITDGHSGGGGGANSAANSAANAGAPPGPPGSSSVNEKVSKTSALYLN